MPFASLLHRSLFLFPANPKTLKFSLFPTAMAANHENAPETNQNYPKPLSPPLPPISRDLELRRAMDASSKSSLFDLTRTDVLYEDEWLIAVNKRKGVYCEAVLSSVPRIVGDDSAEPSRLGEGSQKNANEFHLANRLDRDTSGVMLITKSHKVASKLVKAFTNHNVCKSYVALCIGSAPKWGRITIRSGHGRSKFGAWRVYAASDVGRELPGGSKVRDMETSFEVLSVNRKGNFKELSGYKKAEQEAKIDGGGNKDEVSLLNRRGNFKGLWEFKKDNENFVVVEQEAEGDKNRDKDEVLVRACPRSGRTHQIRLHCQYLGIPIRGDVKYSGVHELKGRTFNGHELHAESVSFEHPVTGLPIIIQAPLPIWVSEHCSR